MKRDEMMMILSTSSVKPLPSHHHHSLIIPNRNNGGSIQPISSKPAIGTAITGAALSLTLLLSSPSPPSFALEFVSPTSNQISSEVCQDDDGGFRAEIVSPNLETNQRIVEEAWQIVNDSYLDVGRYPWSPDSWIRKKEDILSTSIKTRSKAHDTIRRMLASLGDPYSRFLTPEEFSKMARYDMTGIGINLREIPDSSGNFKLKVLGLILDGPAQTAGVRQGDEVLSVDGKDVRGKSAFEVSSMLQGPSETFVTVEVKHGSCGPAQSIKVQRQLVARTPVFYRLEQIDKGGTSIGYVRLKEFNALAKRDIVTAMKRLRDMGASCFVLDLRDNFGGLVQAGIEISKLFLDKGDTVIYTAGRDQTQNAIVAKSAPLITEPLIILVNHNTASASEIVASALHDNCKTVLVGEKTYGKGLIQSVFELRDGSGVVVTVGKYVTPGHSDINGNGIEPDFPNIPTWSEVTERLSSCSRVRHS